MNQDMKSNYLDGPIGYMEFTSGPFYQPKGLINSACQRLLSNKVCNRSNVGVANWVIGRLPVTQSGRNDAQGLRSVNAIFHHHYQMSHRPKVVCSCLTKRCCPPTKQLNVCEPPQHMRLLWGGTIHPKWNKTCM